MNHLNTLSNNYRSCVQYDDQKYNSILIVLNCFKSKLNNTILFSLEFYKTKFSGGIMSRHLLLAVSMLALAVGLASLPSRASAQIVVPWQPTKGEVAAGCAAPSATATGKTWYIDPVNGGANGDGSAAHPWNSLNSILTDGYISTMPKYYAPTNPHAVKGWVSAMADAPIHPGDTILLESGDYGDILIQGAYGQTTFPISGYDNSDFITIEAASGATPVLTSLRLAGGGKWVFRGLTVENILPNLNSRSNSNLVALNGPHHDIIVDGNTLASAPDTSNWTQADWVANAASGVNDYGGVYNGASCITVTNNKISNVGFGISTQRSDGVLIKGNTINYFAYTALTHGSNNVVIQNNLMTNKIDAYGGGAIASAASAAACAAGYHPQFIHGVAWGGGSTTVAGDTLSNIVIDSNIGIRQTDPNLPFTGAGNCGMMALTIFDAQWYNLTVTNNVTVSNENQGLSFYGVHNVVIANNNLLNDGTGSPGSIVINDEKAYESVLAFGTPSTPSSDVVIRNNITTGLGTAVDTINASVDHNLCVHRTRRGLDKALS